MKNLLLSSSGSDEGNTVSMVENGEGQGDSNRRRFGRIGEVGDPAVGFFEEFVAGEEGTGVAVGSVAASRSARVQESDGILQTHPTPSKMRSNLGKAIAFELLPKNVAIICFSYSSATASGSERREVSMT